MREILNTEYKMVEAHACGHRLAFEPVSGTDIALLTIDGIAMKSEIVCAFLCIPMELLDRFMRKRGECMGNPLYCHMNDLVSAQIQMVCLVGYANSSHLERCTNERHM